MELTKKRFTLITLFLVVMILFASYFLIITVKDTLDKKKIPHSSPPEKCIDLYFSLIKTNGEGFEPSCEELLFVDEVNCSEMKVPDKCHFILAKKDNSQCLEIKDISLAEECLAKYRISSEIEL